MRCDIVATSVSATQPHTCHATRLRCSRQRARRGRGRADPRADVAARALDRGPQAEHQDRQHHRHDRRAEHRRAHLGPERHHAAAADREISREHVDQRRQQPDAETAAGEHDQRRTRSPARGPVRHRDAPRRCAPRSPSARDVPFASARFARLLHAMSSSIPTPVSIIPAMVLTASESPGAPWHRPARTSSAAADDRADTRRRAARPIRFSSVRPRSGITPALRRP